MVRKSFKEAFSQLYEKNINWVVMFLLPILVVLMMGIELDNEVIDHIPMAVIDYDNSSFSRELIDAFAGVDTFDIVKYPESQDEMEAMIRDSEARVGLIIPKGFYEDIAQLESPTVLMIYDGSHMSMTSAAKSKATEILLTYKAGATIKQLTGRLGMTYEEALSVASVFNYQNRPLYNPGQSFENFLAIVLMAGYVQGSITLLASISIDHGIFTEKREDRLGYGIGKVLAYTLMGTVSFTICMLLQRYLMHIPFEGSMVDAIILCAALSFAVAGFSVIISTVIRNRMVALLGGAVVFIPNSVMAGTTWPLISMPIGYQGFAAYMPFARFANNLRDIYLKGIGFEQVAGDVRYMLLFGLVSILIVEVVLWIANVEDHEEVTSDAIPSGV